jgi:hypothetical protein
MIKEYQTKTDYKNYELINTTDKPLGSLERTTIDEILSSPSKIIMPSDKIYMSDCGSCPSCGCIEQDVQFLAVIEAPAVVPLLVLVQGLRFTS